MRRHSQFADPAAVNFASSHINHMSGQKMEHHFGHYETPLEAFTPERENSFANPKPEGQWRWEREGTEMSNQMPPHIFNEGQISDPPRSYFQGQRPNPNVALQNQGNSDSRSQPHEDDKDIGYDSNPSIKTFESLEQKFLDDIVKLSKEQKDAEDAENSRHREKINAINVQYEEQLVRLRARHASRRDEFLRRELLVRRQQYRQVVMDPHPSSDMGPNDVYGYTGAPGAGAVGEAQRGYATDCSDPYKENTRFPGGRQDHGFEPRGSFFGDRVYDSSSRYYLS